MKKTVQLFVLFVFWILLWIFAIFFDIPVVLMVVLGVISIIYIFRNKNIEKQDVIVGALFGIVSMPSSMVMGLFTIPAYMGAVSIFKRNGYHKIALIKEGWKQIGISVILPLGVGCVLGIINVFLANATIRFSIKPQWFFDAVRAGITEEVMFRFFFFAMCVCLVKDGELSKLQNILCYLIMIIPHVLLHFNFETIQAGSVIVLSLLFGLPFALLQKKRDLMSAIVSHALVDLIRFIMLGI